MNFADCIQKAIDEKKLSKKKGQKAIDNYNVLLNKHLANGSGADAAAKAASEIAGLEAKLIAQKKRNVVLQYNAIQTQWQKADAAAKANMQEWDDIKSKSAIVRALDSSIGSRWLFYKPSHNRELQKILMTADSHAKGMESFYLNKIRTSLDKYQTSFKDGINPFAANIPTENKQFLEKVWRAAAGEKMEGKTINDAGTEIRAAFDELHELYDKAGGVLGKIENWMPQIHDAGAIKGAGYDRWFNDVINNLDWNKIVNDDGIPFILQADVDKGNYTPALHSFMENVYATLSTDGMNKVVKAGEAGKTRAPTSGGIARRHGHSRVLHFKSPEAQLGYNKMYGNPDVYGQLLRHITSMTKDIAVMRNMGPQPDALVENFAMRSGGVDNFTRKMNNVLQGRTAMTGSESETYKWMRGTQSFLQSAQLGSAFIPAIGDSVYSHYAAKLAGLDGVGTFKNYFTKLTPKEMEAHIFINEASMGNMMEANLSGETMAGMDKTAADKFMETGQKLSTWNMRLSLLSGLTEHGKNNITGSAFAKVAATRELAFDKLPEEFRVLMENSVGMTAKDWDIIRSATPTKLTNTDIEFTFPSDVANGWQKTSELTGISKGGINTEIWQDAAFKYEAYIQYLRRLATNEPTLQTKAVTTGGMTTDTPERMGMNMLFMYRAFPITMWNNYVRTLAMRAAKNGGSEMAGFILATTGAGLATLWAKDVKNNKTPREIDAGVVGQAMLQGGALGIFGDFVKSDSNRFGQSLAQTLAGPMIGFLGDTAKLIKGDALDAAYGYAVENDTKGWDKFRDNSAQYAKRYLPGASLWHMRATMSYTVGENLDQFISGDEYYNRRRREQKRMIEAGQDYIKQ